MDEEIIETESSLQEHLFMYWHFYVILANQIMCIPQDIMNTFMKYQFLLNNASS